MYYEDVFLKLNDRKVHYVVVGGVALVLHGVVRLTADLDLMVEMTQENLTKFISALKELGYRPKPPVQAEEFIDPANRKRWKDEKGMQVFSFYHPQMKNRLIDVFVDEPIDYGEIERDKKIMTAKGIRIPVISKEHLKRLKSISGRPQDLADIDALDELEML
ncbi:MAG: hypothetical protein HY354_00845 [Planctomycetes bacterium]|nr:hypothetical protein [Planctomycetota bacterium]